MVQIILKDEIDKYKISVLLELLRSWNIKAELKQTFKETNSKKEPFSLAEGIWSDYEIDGHQLRERAWNSNK